MNKDTQQLLQLTLDKAVDNGTVAGVNLLVTQHGQDRHYVQSGMRSIERNQAMTRDTIFRLYSQTKPITGTAVMMLVERGLIDLAEPVSDFLPGFKGQRVSLDYPDSERPAVTITTGSGSGDSRRSDVPAIETTEATRPVLIRDLLTMTSGLVYPGNDSATARWTAGLFDEIDARLKTPKALTTIQIANRLGSAPLLFQPGSHWMYGTSADVLGAVVEVVSGKRFGDFLRQEIFEPLGMRDTAFFVPKDKIDRLAAVYDNPSNPVDPDNAGLPLHEIETDHLGVQYRPTIDPSYQAGGAGLKSTVDDYAKFGQMLLNGGTAPDGTKLIQPATIRFMTTSGLTPQTQAEYENWQNGYGYNTLMRTAQRPGRSETICNVGEFGWDGWLGTFFCDDPATGTTFLMMYQLTNSGTTPFTRAVKNIVFSHLDDE